MSRKLGHADVPKEYYYNVSPKSLRSRLTPRERWLTDLVTQGLMNKEIATVAKTTEQVIKNYLRMVYDKVGCDTRLQLALAVTDDKQAYPAEPEPEPGKDPNFMRGKKFRGEAK